MAAKKLLFPIFLLGLAIVNLKALLGFIFFPLFRHRFFSFSLIVMILYLTFFSGILLKSTQPILIKPMNELNNKESLSLINFNKFSSLEKGLNEIIFETGGTTNLYINLARVYYYQGKTDLYFDSLETARTLDPNHPYFISK